MGDRQWDRARDYRGFYDENAWPEQRNRHAGAPRGGHHEDKCRSQHHDDRYHRYENHRRYEDELRHREKVDPHSHLPKYRTVEQPKDEKLADGVNDPRGDDPTKRLTKKACHQGNGRNTESFDPASTLVRPALRVVVGSPIVPKLQKKNLSHDDVVIVPELFGAQDDWKLYYQLVEEMQKSQGWTSWHEGAHLIVKKPEQSETFKKIIDRLCEYFDIKKDSIGYRFNWYKDSSDWKPLHHDSA